MKNLRNFALAAFALLGFAACQQEEFAPEIKNPTHSVTFVAGAPETKTTATIDGKTVNYAWTRADEKRFTAYENGTKATETVGILNVETGIMTLMAEFGGTATGNETYVAVVNKSNDGQIMTSAAYDEDADILVSKAVSTFDGKNGVLLQFKREVAIAKMTLKGLDPGEVVNHVTVSSTAEIAGSYGVDGWASPAKTSLEISSALYMGGEGYSIKASDAGEAVVWFTCIPQDEATLTVKVEAADGDKYTKTFSKPITLTRGNVKAFGVAMTKDVVAKPWVAVELANIDETMPLVITMATTEKTYALSLTGTDGKALGSTKAPKAIEVSVAEGKLSEEPGSDILWNIANSNGNLTIYPNGVTSKWLYTLNDNNGVRLGTNTTNGYVWSIDATSGYLKASSPSVRYLGVYVTGSDWRAYDKTTGNIANQTLRFYSNASPKTALATPTNLTVSAEKLVSWDVVNGAKSYVLTIGTEEYPCLSNSYNASAIADEYYDVAVVAIPSDKENYKNSAAATLSGAKFGTPTLAMPTLKEGVVDGASISVSWTVDERATAGYNCELFKGEVKVGEGQIVKVGTVTFTGLDAETAYVVKVNAIAVEGAKAYAASPVATLDVTTKAASAAANDGSLEHPYTAAEAIAVIDSGTGLTGKYVKGIVKETPSFNSTYSSLSYDIVSGEATLYIYSGKDLGKAGFVGAEDLKAGDEVVVCGTLKKFNTTYELDKNNYLISINGKTEICRGLAVSEPKIAFNVGDDFEFGGKVLQVWRGKEDVDVTASATFSGYNMATEGKQTVTVTVGKETVAYEITVNPAGAALPITITKTMDSIVTENNYTLSSGSDIGTKQTTLKIDDVIELSSTGGGNTGSFWGTSPNIDWRCYEATNSVVKISAKAGYIIEKLTLTFTPSNYGTLNEGNVKSGTEYNVNAQSVSYKIGHSKGTKNGQIRITAISVTYKQQ